MDFLTDAPGRVSKERMDQQMSHLRRLLRQAQQATVVVDVGVLNLH